MCRKECEKCKHRRVICETDGHDICKAGNYKCFQEDCSDYEEGYNVLCIRNIVSSVSDRSLLIATNKDIEKGEDLNIKVYWVFKKDRDCYQVIEKTEEYVIVLDEIDNEIKMDVNLFKECFVVEENKI